MQVAQFSLDKIECEPHASAEFLDFLTKNSFGFVPNDWENMTSPEITSLAVEFWHRLENEIQVLEYLRRSKYELH
jgi:hypothetical protein